MKHRKFGGSTAARTIACPAWHTQSEGIPRTESEYARVGTALHAVMEDILTNDLDDLDVVGVSYEGIEITRELWNDKIEPALVALDDLVTQYGVTEYEPEVECSYAEDIGGYADCILRGGDAVIVLDWKFGDGFLVSPYDSPQAKFYGMAARKDSSAKDLFEGATRFVAAIIQPTDRADTLSTWETDISVLDEFEKQHARSVKEAKSKHPPLAINPHCNFCPAAPICPAKTGQALSALRMAPEDLETLHDSLDLVSDLKSWISSVEKVAFEQLNAGVEVKGWKLVAKRGLAKWIDEKAVLKFVQRRLGGLKKVTVSKLLSPAQMKKLAKDRGVDIELDEYIITESSGTTMAPEDDKRPAVLAGEAIAKALGLLN